MENQQTAQPTTQPAQAQEQVHQNPIQIGVAWNKTSKKNGAKFISVAPVGGRDKDGYELILRAKSDGSELDLFNADLCSVVIMNNNFKSTKVEDAKKPDYTLKVFIKE